MNCCLQVLHSTWSWKKLTHEWNLNHLDKSGSLSLWCSAEFNVLLSSMSNVWRWFKNMLLWNNSELSTSNAKQRTPILFRFTFARHQLMWTSPNVYHKNIRSIDRDPLHFLLSSSGKLVTDLSNKTFCPKMSQMSDCLQRQDSLVLQQVVDPVPRLFTMSVLYLYVCSCLTDSGFCKIKWQEKPCGPLKCVWQEELSGVFMKWWSQLKSRSRFIFIFSFPELPLVSGRLTHEPRLHYVWADLHFRASASADFQT